MKRLHLLTCAAAATLALALPAANARNAGPSGLSEASALPVALSVTVPAMLVVGGAALTVVAVQATAEGTQWVLERASDGARTAITWGAHGAGLASVAVGTTLQASASASGTLLTHAGQVVAFVPNTLGRALLHTERVAD